MDTTARSYGIQTRHVPRARHIHRRSAVLDEKPNQQAYEREGNKVNEKKVFIMEMIGDYYRGIVARTESEAREIAIQRNHQIKAVVRVEKMIETEGDE
jgi:hypothetical protein